MLVLSRRREERSEAEAVDALAAAFRGMERLTYVGLRQNSLDECAEQTLRVAANRCPLAVELDWDPSNRAMPRALPPELRKLCPAATLIDVYVDSMATVPILRAAPPGFCVTQRAPNLCLDSLAGPLPVAAVGAVGLYLLIEDGATGVASWRSFELQNVHIVPAAVADLYSTRAMHEQHGARHDFEGRSIQLGGGSARVTDDGVGYILSVGLGPCGQTRAATASSATEVSLTPPTGARV